MTIFIAVVPILMHLSTCFPSGHQSQAVSVTQTIIINYGPVKKIVKPLFIFWITFIRFGSKVYRQTIGIPMGTNCTSLVADLFLFCYENDFMKSLARENQDYIIIEAFNSTCIY